ncbi:MAG: M48 family metallopeptidase [Vicinamibacteria bacterium]|nr:M48 family metallopeptidase [Vicinamibacteria bacterium]
MNETFRVGNIVVTLTRKDVKHVHLSVHPPNGRVTLVAPVATRLAVARAYAISRLGWIRKQRAALRGQARETPRQFVTRESHYVWGKRYLLRVEEVDQKPSVVLDHRRITLRVRPGSDRDRRAAVMHQWHRALLHQAVPRLIEKWERRLGVRVAAYFLQRMKTRWGGCNPRAGHIRLNTELVRKPKDLLEYVIVHELAHLLAPTHSEEFVALLDRHYPAWRDARAELNALPLAAEDW